MAEQIIENLWLGDANDAQHWSSPQDSLCVLEAGRSVEGELWCPILEMIAGRVIARAERLDEAARIIRHKLKARARLLVHCGAGVERSPLTIAWYLVKSDRARWPSMRDAYAHIMQRRPVVGDRQFWLERQP